MSFLAEGAPVPVVPREAIVYRLAVLDGRGELTSECLRMMAQCAGRSERTLWRWLEAARAGQITTPGQVRSHAFTVTEELRVRLAYCRGNIAAVHRDLLAEAQDGTRVPSRAALYRAIRRDLTVGELAGLRHGERAGREHDVYLTRPRVHRNAAWEGDHVQAPVEVLVGDTLIKPWVTWFIDTGSHAIPGLAVTPGYPSREAILVALRAAVLTADPYGPVGGLPSLVRIDQGKDFLSKAVGGALGACGVQVVDLPGYTPFGKGSIEELNLHAEKDLFARLLRYTHRQKTLNNKPVDPHQPALTFPAFVEEVLSWVRKRNTAHRPKDLGGKSPQEAWLADPTPVDVPPAEHLRLMTLEPEDGVRVLTSQGVMWNSRYYVGPWMNGSTDAHLKVRIRVMPHHIEEIEVFDASGEKYLGSATLSDRAPDSVVGAVMAGRSRRAQQLRRDFAAAEKQRRVRYAAVSAPEPAKALTAMTLEQAEREAAGYANDNLAALARPGLVPHTPAPASWVAPRKRARTEEP